MVGSHTSRLENKYRITRPIYESTDQTDLTKISRTVAIMCLGGEHY